MYNLILSHYLINQLKIIPLPTTRPHPSYQTSHCPTIFDPSTYSPPTNQPIVAISTNHHYSHRKSTQTEVSIKDYQAPDV